MKHLLDVDLLIACAVKSHTSHAKGSAWMAGKEMVICPLSELGFLRVTTNPRTVGFTMRDARAMLANFVTVNGVHRIPADLDALNSHPPTFSQVTDHYLADLAAKHGLKLATLDAGIKHASAELVF